MCTKCVCCAQNNGKLKEQQTVHLIDFLCIQLECMPRKTIDSILFVCMCVSAVHKIETVIERNSNLYDYV